jgi:hypothetical protein
MSLVEELDLGDDTPETLEHGGHVSPGWKHVKVEDVYDDPKNQGTLVLLLRVLTGKAKGAAHYERLWSPTNAADEQKAQSARNRRKLFAKRLGLIGDGDAGKNVSVDWADAIGREALVKIKRDLKKGANGEPDKEFTNVEFAGVYRVDHPDVPPEALREAGLPPRGGPNAPAGAAGGTPTGPTPAPAGGNGRANKERDLSSLM